jgi:hypothetical protein
MNFRIIFTKVAPHFSTETGKEEPLQSSINLCFMIEIMYINFGRETLQKATHCFVFDAA